PANMALTTLCFASSTPRGSTCGRPGRPSAAGSCPGVSMSRCLPSPLLVLAVLVLAASPAVSVAQQPRGAIPEPIARRAVAASGYVHGTVTDQLGRTVDGVSIL